MQITVLREVFETLQANKLVDNESDFSTDWLGRSECYMRSLRFHRTEPSVASVAICASKLQHYGKRLTASEQHKELGQQFIELSELCHQHINASCEASWIDQMGA